MSSILAFLRSRDVWAATRFFSFFRWIFSSHVRWSNRRFLPRTIRNSSIDSSSSDAYPSGRISCLTATAGAKLIGMYLVGTVIKIGALIFTELFPKYKTWCLTEKKKLLELNHLPDTISALKYFDHYSRSLLVRPVGVTVWKCWNWFITLKVFLFVVLQWMMKLPWKSADECSYAHIPCCCWHKTAAKKKNITTEFDSRVVLLVDSFFLAA